MANFENIQSAELEEKIKDGLDGVLLDVRTSEEVADAHIPNMVNIDIRDPEFMDEVDKLDKDKTYYVYCRSGARSAHACQQMASMGFEKLYNLEGGILGWTGETESDN